MRRRVEFDPAARSDFDEAFDWYAVRSHAAAVGFAAAVDDSVIAASESPARFSRTVRGCRMCRLKKYPYYVAFIERGDSIYIVAIAHAKRRPAFWKDRL